mgnify:FL=1|jgi:small conductance mechanosensitive channel
MKNIDFLNIDQYISQFLHILVDYSPRVISALIILIVGWYAIMVVKKIVRSIMTKREMDVTLVNFLSNFLIWLLKALLFVTVISRLGVETSSFVALLGAAGLAVGLALQGSLSNFAGGILIILFKPFKVGDFIEAQGVSGTVKEIQIFVTRLTTPDNHTIFVPNGALSNGNIINYTLEGIRRADITIGISYNSNIKTAKDVALQVMLNNELVLKEPAPLVMVRELADSSVNLWIRPWCKAEDFWAMRSSVIEECKNAFNENGVEIPFPQRDIHIKA